MPRGSHENAHTAVQPGDEEGCGQGARRFDWSDRSGCCRRRSLVLAERRGPTDPDARVEGRVYPLDAGVDGRVAQVLVQENQAVQAGDPLVLLDEGYLNARLAETRLALEALRAGLSPAAADPGGRSSATAEEAIRARMQAAREQENAARRDVEQLSVEHARLQLEARRLDALSGPGTPSLDRVNRARLAELTAREALEEAQRRFEAISRARVTADGELDRYRAELAAAARMPANVRGIG